MRISVERVDGAARMIVSDDGVGGADPAGGSGLRGLADRVEALDGRLTIDSPPGAGTTLRAELPLTSGKPPARNGTVPYGGAMARTVLVVDDSAAFRATARMLLQARGYEVVGVAGDVASGLATAARAAAGLRAARRQPARRGRGDARRRRFDGAAVVLVSTLDEAAIGDVEASGARGFVPKAELASPRLVELLGPP